MGSVAVSRNKEEFSHAPSTDYLLNSLASFGLNTYEAKLYLALLQEGTATARLLSSNTGIPYGKVYEVVRNLVEKGFVRPLTTKPLRCAPIPPTHVLVALEQQSKQRMEALSSIVHNHLNNLFEQKKPVLEKQNQVTVLHGRQTVNQQIPRIITAATKNLTFAVSSTGIQLIRQYESLLSEAKQRGISITFVLPEGTVMPKQFYNLGLIEHRIASLPASFIANENEGLLVEHDPNTRQLVQSRDIGMLLTNTSFLEFFQQLML